MKDIILKELTLQDWKSQNRHIVFGERENRVSGRNKAGKSTLMKAFYWLLSGYSDSQTNPNQDIFDNTKEISPETPKASVTAVISIDGEEYKLQRCAEAAFTRKRGTNEMVKSASDNYSYFIDDIARTKSDWTEWLNEHIASEDMLRFVLSGDFFVAKIFEDKKAARQIIEKLVGKVERSEMQGDYSCIDVLLAKFSLDEIDARCANLSKGIEQRLNEIPALINNKEAEISEIEQTDFVAIDKDIAKLEQERTDLDKRMTDLTERIRPQMEAKHEAERTKQMKEEVFEKAYQDWKRSFDTRRKKLKEEISAIRQQNAKSKTAREEAEQRQELAKSDLASLETQLANLNGKRNRLVAERDAEKEKKLDPSATICPHCGAELQGDKLQAVIDNFERVKRERINAIVADGKDTAEKIERLKASIERTKKLVEEPLPQVITRPTEDLEKRVLEIANTDTSKIAFMETEQGKTLLDDIGAVVIPEVVMPDNTEIVNAKKEVNDRLIPLYERRGLKKRLQTLRDAVDELRVEQKEKGAELAQYELQRQSVKAYKQEQMEILSHKVNDGLKCSRIDVWSKQKDGTMVPDLVLKDAEGVSFQTTNNASRITTTIDLQRFFCEKLGVRMPIWCDEATIFDSNNLPKFDDSQSFYLFCSDTALTIESK